ncbi:carbohydrate binding family 9 domain-containing protein [Catenovulum agarivorans]|uniref:carbohydrate binding family 9 domain-containing protein n=1 Tax=Catenovulum agarivorans TaxID=1172192 RepID=UPI0002FD8844|nr:carbohydrate binding family 9 domain-containing protein [Catenovulum agarivorans]
MYQKLIKTITLILTAGLFSTSAIANTISIPNLSEQIVLDGQLNESVWQQAAEFQLNYVTFPYDNTQAPVTTTAYVFHDAHYLYVGFKANDPNPAQIRSHLKDRDLVWDDDLIGFKLDTYNNAKFAYQFFVNPDSVQIDSLENEFDKSTADDWNAIWQAKTQLTESGYSAEFKIPFDQLSFADSKQLKNWQIEFIRKYPRNVHYQISNVKKDKNQECVLCQMQSIRGFEQATTASQFLFTPTLSAISQKQRQRFDPEQWQSDNQVEIGADLNWQISSNSRLTATINPDFSQVEADSAQLDINSTYALYFDEKRRFFVENSDQFGSLFNLLHTRNIAKPEAGVKFVSRSQQHSFATLLTNDESTLVQLPGTLGSSIVEYQQKSTNAAARYRFDSSEDFSIGAFATSRQSDDYHNHVVALDSKYSLTDSTTIEGQFVWSDTQYPDAFEQTSPGTGEAWQIKLNHNQRNFWFNAEYQQVAEDFRADLGQVNSVNRKYQKVRAGYVEYFANSAWSQFEFWAGGEKKSTLDNQAIEDNVEIQFNFKGPKQSRISTGAGIQHKVGRYLDQGMFNTNFAFFYGEMNLTPSVFSSVLLLRANAVDYFNNSQGDKFQIHPIVKWNVNKHLNIQLTHTYENMDSGSNDLYLVNLSDLRVSYQYNHSHKSKLSVVYNNLKQNIQQQELNYLQHNQSVSAKFIHSWRFDAFTAAHFGFSINMLDDSVLQGFTTQQKAAFFKVSYTF